VQNTSQTSPSSWNIRDRTKRRYTMGHGQRFKMKHINVFFPDAVFNSATPAAVHKQNVSRLRNISLQYDYISFLKRDCHQNVKDCIACIYLPHWPADTDTFRLNTETVFLPVLYACSQQSRLCNQVAGTDHTVTWKGEVQLIVDLSSEASH
jgi:hypothetical protein